MSEIGRNHSDDLLNFVEYNPNPIIAVNRAGEVKYLNLSGRVLFPVLPTMGSSHPLLNGILSSIIREDNEESREWLLFNREVEFNDRFYEQQFISLRNSPLFFVYLTDITEKRNFSEHLREVNQQLKTEIAARQKHELELKALSTQLQNSLLEKEVLLKEIHHRVKNNVQVISSLLSLQSQATSDEKAKGVLTESSARVKAIALVHEFLYQSSNLSEISLLQYTRALFNYLLEVYIGQDTRIVIDNQFNDLKLSLDTAIPLGLIMSEIISNACKHAFPGERSGKIMCTMTERPGELELVVSDDGVGMPPDINFDTASTLGLRLIHNLTSQLKGRINLDVKVGTRYTLAIPHQQKRDH